MPVNVLTGWIGAVVWTFSYLFILVLLAFPLFISSVLVWELLRSFGKSPVLNTVLILLVLVVIGFVY